MPHLDSPLVLVGRDPDNGGNSSGSHSLACTFKDPSGLFA
jgi:hypothetical protein